MRKPEEWLIYDLEDEHLLDALLLEVHNELIKADLRTYSKDTVSFTFKIYHPKKDLVAAPIKLGKVPAWDAHILKHVDENDLVKITGDWKSEIE